MSSLERRGADGRRRPLLGAIALGLCLGGCASGGGSLSGEQGVFQPAAQSGGGGTVSTPGVAALSADCPRLDLVHFVAGKPRRFSLSNCTRSNLCTILMTHDSCLLTLIFTYFDTFLSIFSSRSL